MDYFNLKFTGATLKDEIFAGITLFITLAYNLVVLPAMLFRAGMPYDGVFIVTILVIGITTIVSAFYTKLPIVFGPGLGLLSTFLSFAVGKNAVDFRVLLLATYVSGILFLVFVKYGIYRIFINILDLDFRRIIMSGIGLALILYGISITGLIQTRDIWYVPGTVNMIPLTITAITLIAMFGMRKKKIKGHVLYGILIAYVLGMFYEYYQNGYLAGMSAIGYVRHIFNDSYQLSGLKEIMFAFPDVLPILVDKEQCVGFLYIVLLFTFAHFFESIGTNSAIFETINLYIDKRIKDDKSIEKAVTIDGMGSIASGLLGVSSVTTYAESLVGVISGGKTGITALVTGSCFLACFFVSPLFTSMPIVVAAPVLIYIGLILTAKYRDFHKRKFIVNLYGVILILILGVTFSTGAVVIYGLLGYTLLTAVIERRKPVKYWWVTLIFACVQTVLYLRL